MTDLNSGHGIFVEGQRIEKNVRVLLKNGVGIRFPNLESAKMLFLLFFSGPGIFEALSVSGTFKTHFSDPVTNLRFWHLHAALLLPRTRRIVLSSLQVDTERNKKMYDGFLMVSESCYLKSPKTRKN